MIVALLVRLWHFNAVGYNSDEAVYAGQGAGIAARRPLAAVLPGLPRPPAAVPVVVSLGYRFGVRATGRAAARGIVRRSPTVLASSSSSGGLLYGAPRGALAALLLALMPYHVVVTPAGPARRAADVLHHAHALPARALRATRARATGCTRPGPGMGLRSSPKETERRSSSAAIYAFFALSPDDPRARRGIDRCRSLVICASRSLPFPLAVLLAGRPSTGGNFLAWQLFRRPNHTAPSI